MWVAVKEVLTPCGWGLRLDGNFLAWLEETWSGLKAQRQEGNQPPLGCDLLAAQFSPPFSHLRERPLALGTDQAQACACHRADPSPGKERVPCLSPLPFSH